MRRSADRDNEIPCITDHCSCLNTSLHPITIIRFLYRLWVYVSVWDADQECSLRAFFDSSLVFVPVPVSHQICTPFSSLETCVIDLKRLTQCTENAVSTFLAIWPTLVSVLGHETFLAMVTNGLCCCKRVTLWRRCFVGHAAVSNADGLSLH